MKINRNMSAVMTNKQLFRTEKKLSTSMQRLSSGYKINRAGDDPAGLAISSKMKAQIDGLDRAKSNSADGQSVLRIADGALNEVSSILQRARELSVKAANGTNSYSDRQSIQKEIDELVKEVDRISSDTEYNAKTLLDGSADVRVYSKEAERIDVSEDVIPKTYKIKVTEAAEKAEYVFDKPNTYADGTLTINNVTMKCSRDISDEGFFENLRKTAEQAGCELTKDTTGGTVKYKLTSKEYGSDENIKIEVSKNVAATIGVTSDATATYDDKTGEYTVNKYGKDAKVALDTTAAGGFSNTATASVDGTRVKATDRDGFSIDFMLKDDSNVVNKEVDIEVTDIGRMAIQVGANQYQEIKVKIPEVSAKSLYLDKLDVTVTGGPEKAMVTLDDAIAKLNSVRSQIGSFTNRLEYAESSLAETHEDITSAYSGIMDTDMAEEMTEYTQQNVLEQATISVLAQANDLPQQVLSLLQ